MWMKYLNQTHLLQLFTLGSALILFSGMGSCSMSAQQICTDRLPELDRKLEAAIAVLDPGGAPASRLAPADRESWRRWAEERLSEAQGYADYVEGIAQERRVRSELSDVATGLVSFHGYARQGKGERMMHTLEAIQEHVAKARELVCPSRDVASVRKPRS